MAGVALRVRVVGRSTGKDLPLNACRNASNWKKERRHIICGSFKLL